MEIKEPLTLLVSEKDVPNEERESLEREILATRTLGGQEESLRRFLDLLPTIVANRVQEVIPSDFVLEELEFLFKLEGKLFGSGIGGEVVARLKRRINS